MSDFVVLVAVVAVGLVLATLGTVAIVFGKNFTAQGSPNRASLEVRRDPEADEAARKKQSRLRENLLHACGGNEDTLALMLDMASGKTSTREIASVTGKTHTTIWRKYKATLKAMSKRITPP